MSDDDSAALGIINSLCSIARNSLRSLDNHEVVQSGEPGAHGAAQSSRAKLETRSTIVDRASDFVNARRDDMLTA